MQGSSCATDGGLTPTLNNLTSLPESEEGNSWLTPWTLSLYTVDIGLHNCGGPQLRRFLWYDLYPSWESVKPCGEMSVNPLEAVLLSLISLGGSLEFLRHSQESVLRMTGHVHPIHDWNYTSRADGSAGWLPDSNQIMLMNTVKLCYLH